MLELKLIKENEITPKELEYRFEEIIIIGSPWDEGVKYKLIGDKNTNKFCWLNMDSDIIVKYHNDFNSIKYALSFMKNAWIFESKEEYFKWMLQEERGD